MRRRRSDRPSRIDRCSEAYFLGLPVDPAKLPVDPRGTPFQLRVWAALRKVPRGEVRSYGEIAETIGASQAARAVGAACGANPAPIAIPCHRVVGASMTLGGFSGGLERKIQLLQLEGMRVLFDAKNSKA